MAVALPGGKVAASSNIGGEEYQRFRNFHEDISGSKWTVGRVASSNSVASSTKASAGTGVRNVCTDLTIKFVAGTTAPSAANVNVYLIDGASGGTTYLWQATVSLPATAGADNGIALSGLWFPGTAATGMTLEFSAAGGANTIESVSMSGTTIAE